MIYWELFVEFLRVGLFSFGGGHAALPFLYNISEFKQWYTIQQLTDMIAMGSVVPGAFGVNVAAFAGFSTAGVFGALIAVTALIAPSFIIAVAISGVLVKFKKNAYVIAIINVLKPVSCGLLAAVGAQIFVDSVNNLFGALLLGILLLIYFYRKRTPVFVLGVSAIAGLAAGLLQLI